MVFDLVFVIGLGRDDSRRMINDSPKLAFVQVDDRQSSYATLLGVSA